MAPTSLEEEKCGLHDMRHSAAVCDAYQTTDVAYLNDWELWIMSIGGRVFSMKKYALLRPSSGHYGDHTEHKGNDRKEHRCETLDETLC
jgi:hypothetical protein